MSTDKLQALDEVLADAFVESPLTHTESSHPVFDHEALSGIFGQSPPISTSTQPSHPNFDQGTFAEILSQPPPVSADTTPAHPNLDWQALAEILSQPLPISTQTRPAHPSFDQESLVEILSQSSTDPANTKASPPGFDHPALAEILSKPQPAPINPQRSSFSFDTEPTSAPLSGQRDNEGPAAKTVVVAPSTDAEDARSQRPKSLLAKLHHIFSTKAEPPPSGIEKDPSPPSGQLHKPEPMTEAIAAASPANDEDARQQQAGSLLTELLSPGFDRQPSSPRLTGRPGNDTPAASDAAAGSPTDTANAQTQQARSSLVAPPASIKMEPTASTTPTEAESAGARQDSPSLTEPHLISINREASSPARETETPRPPIRSQLGRLGPAAEIAAVALSANSERARPQRATSLLAAEAPAPNPDTKSPPVDFLTQPTRAPQPDNLGPATSSVAARPKPPLPVFEKEPPRLYPAIRTVSVAPPPDAERAVTRAQQTKSPLAELELSTAIRLRWVMRDIRSERTKLSPPGENDLAVLVELGLVEMPEGLPRLTALGVLALD